VVIDRASFGKSIVFPPSHCEHCRKKLGFSDLIPVLSFVMLGGKCRYCRKPISYFYPIIELATGFLFVLVVFVLFSHFSYFLFSVTRYMVLALYYLVIFSSLVIIFFTDFKYGLIPFKIVLISVVLTLIFYLFFPFLHFKPDELTFLSVSNFSFFNFVFSALGVFAFFFSLFLITKGRGLGFGDVIYVFLMGFLLGFPSIILGLYIAFISGAVISLILVLAGRKKLTGSTIPFGPFLVGGTMISLLWGQEIINKVIALLLYR
jgi:prepilin signal peptidase PulO-like enzyme (type II secretory pathway)